MLRISGQCPEAFITHGVPLSSDEQPRWLYRSLLCDSQVEFFTFHPKGLQGPG